MKFKMLFIAAGMFVACTNSSAIDFKEGNWAVEMQMEIAGMPMQMPPVTVDQCMSKKDMVPAQKSQDGTDCKIIDQSVKGSTVTWAVECPESKGKGSMTYKGKSFSGKIYIETTGSSRSMKMTSIMKGRYKGPCRK